MTQFRRLAIFTLAAPVTLALAACGSEAGDATANLSGEPIEATPAPEGESWNETAVVTDMGGVRVGNPDAPLELVEYASHTCPACANFSTEAHSELEEYIATGVVSFEIRNQVHDALDLTIAMMVRCGDPAATHLLAHQAWENLNSIVGNAQANGDALNRAMQIEGPERFPAIAEASGLLDFFAARGISRDQAVQCLSDVSTAEQIVENSGTQSDELGVTGTPTFFLNGVRLEGSNWASVKEALEEAGAR